MTLTRETTAVGRQTKLPETSRAAVLTEFGESLEIRELPVPTELEPGALLVRILASSICGSDVHLWSGTLGGSQAMELPVIPGHEMVGEIVAVGEGADTDTFGSDLSIGDRILYTHGSCGRCFHCAVANQPTLCADRRYYMFTNCERPPYLVGGFSEYCYVFPQSGRVKVPDAVDTAWASAASCALRTVVHSFDRIGRIEPWQNVVIQGAGPLGLFATALASRAGAARVITIGAPDNRLEIAKAYGATDVLSVEEVPSAEERPAAVRSLLGRGADIVFEFSGARSAFLEGLEMVEHGGRYMVTGQIAKPGEEISFLPGVITRRQLTVMGTWSGHINEYWKSLQFMEQTKGQYDWDLLTPNRYSLERATEALRRMKAQEDIKPIIEPSGS
ncbi:zinc-binding dehydrogenase [Aeromicrobium sp. CTD01-1L150]|uniref:zinc-binding dehydrogenase n=1 Tax=Aeromicrobium sp. CTD01-1L150 TaxID=3341830 RepID=UPI0035BFEF6E